MFEIYDIQLKALIDVISERNYIIVKQGKEEVLQGNCYHIALNYQFMKYKDCNVKNIISIANGTILIEIETEEERIETERIQESRKHFAELRNRNLEMCPPRRTKRNSR
jgi:hypothetical protein